MYIYVCVVKDTDRDSSKNIVSKMALSTTATVLINVLVKDPNRFNMTDILKPYTALKQHKKKTLGVNSPNHGTL
jgi:hypothetical protein